MSAIFCFLLAGPSAPPELPRGRSSVVGSAARFWTRVHSCLVTRSCRSSGRKGYSAANEVSFFRMHFRIWVALAESPITAWSQSSLVDPLAPPPRTGMVGVGKEDGDSGGGRLKPGFHIVDQDKTLCRHVRINVHQQLHPCQAVDAL